MKHVLRLTLVTALLLLFSLALTPLAAQDDGPPRVGLRPDAPPYALHGPYWVGTMEFTAATDWSGTVLEAYPNLQTRIQVWYPALNPSGVDETITYHDFDLSVNGHAIFYGRPDSEHGPYPLVIFSGAGGAYNPSSAYLCEHLASYGFVVIAIDHEDRFLGWVVNYTSNYTRPRDISWTIDYAATLTGDRGRLEGMIDTERIAVAGHSFGAYTALMAAGARLDYSSESWCGQYPDTAAASEVGGFRLCPSASENAEAYAELIQVAGLEAAPEGLWPSWGDPHVDAIVPLAAGYFDFGSASFEQVTVPVMVMMGSSDHFAGASNPLYLPYAYEYLGSTNKSLVVFEGADHHVFSNDCEAIPWAVEYGLFWGCADAVWDVDRAHDLINHFTTAFLLSVLYGDADAPAALAPAAVSFPGITYETTGF